MIEKECKTCHIVKKVVYLYTSKSTTDGYYNDCIGCHRAVAREHQKNHPRPQYNCIKEVLKEKNIKIKELAKLIDMSYIMTSKYVSNHFQPTIVTLFKIAEALEVSAPDLLINTSNLKPSKSRELKSKP
jgi:hypothetical protein